MAKKVSESIRTGNARSLGQLAVESGYPLSTSKSPSQITRSKSFIEAVKPMLPQLEGLQQKFVSAIGRKNLDKEKLPVLLSGFDILTKNKQLLSGKATENIAIHVEISERVADKYTNTTSQEAQPVKKEAEKSSVPETQ